ncbi:Protein T10B10.4 a, partial [Aphelenchoides avenae]
RCWKSFSIRNLAECKFLSFPARAFLHSDPSGSELYFVVRNTPNRVFTTVACIVTAKFDVDAVHKSLDGVLRRCNDWFTRGRYNLLYGVESAVNLFIGWVKQRSCGKDFHFTPTHLFYMTQQQMDTVDAMKHQLPDGYSMVKMDAERDAQFVTDCWKFKLPKEVVRTKETLQAIPSYAVKHDASGELAAFELIDVSSGYMYHLFTTEQHRRKGLANAVELANCRLCM